MYVHRLHSSIEDPFGPRIRIIPRPQNPLERLESQKGLESFLQTESVGDLLQGREYSPGPGSHFVVV